MQVGIWALWSSRDASRADAGSSRGVVGATAGGRAPRGRRQRPDTLAAPTAARSAPRHCHVCAHRGPGGVRRQRVGRGSACRPWRVCAVSRRYQWGWQWGWRLCVGAPGSARESLFRDAVPPPAVRGGGEVPCTFYASFWQFCRALQDAGSGCAAMPGETGLRCLPHWSAARRRLRSRVPSFRPRCHSSTCNRLSCRAAASSCDSPATKHATLLHLGACRPSAWPSRPRLNRRRRWLPPQTLAAREQWLSSHTAARGCTHTQQGLPGTCWLSARAAAQHLGGHVPRGAASFRPGPAPQGRAPNSLIQLLSLPRFKAHRLSCTPRSPPASRTQSLRRTTRARPQRLPDCCCSLPMSVAAAGSRLESFR